MYVHACDGVCNNYSENPVCPVTALAIDTKPNRFSLIACLPPLRSPSYTVACRARLRVLNKFRKAYLWRWRVNAFRRLFTEDRNDCARVQGAPCRRRGNKDFRKQFRTRQPRTWYDRIACNSTRGLSIIELTRCLFVSIYLIHSVTHYKRGGGRAGGSN